MWVYLALRDCVFLVGGDSGRVFLGALSAYSGTLPWALEDVCRINIAALSLAEFSEVAERQCRTSDA